MTAIKDIGLMKAASEVIGIITGIIMSVGAISWMFGDSEPGAKIVATPNIGAF